MNSALRPGGPGRFDKGRQRHCQCCSSQDTPTSDDWWEELAQGLVGQEAQEEGPQTHQRRRAQQLAKYDIKGDTLGLHTIDGSCS